MKIVTKNGIISPVNEPVAIILDSIDHENFARMRVAGKYKLICFPKEMTEQVARQIIREQYDEEESGYENFIS